MSGDVGRDQVLSLRRSCVECGLCLPHCATYLATGSETQSPRGRIFLLGEVLEGRLAADEASVREAFDQCLGCLACTAVCPSGVSADLLDHLRGLAAAGSGPAGPVRWLDRRAVQRGLRRGGGLARAGARVLLGPRWRRKLEKAPRPWPRLARLLGTLPADPGDDAELCARLGTLLGGTAPPAQPAPAVPATPPRSPRRRVAVFRGCADEQLLPASARRLRSLLRALGCELVVPGGQDCCGALASHLENRDRAELLRRRNREAFAPHLADCDHVLVTAAGCARELGTLPGELAGRIIDPVSLLDSLLADGAAASELAPLPLRVAVHDPCHARHGRGVIAAPRRLLQSIPQLRLLEPEEAEVCCGSAGVYGVRHAGLSAIMGRRKAEVLAATGCDLVVTSNPGCLGQLSDALALVAPELPILPLTDLIWYAHLGARRSKESS
jgi:glycolate oxidase iron-sulfur subunit